MSAALVPADRDEQAVLLMARAGGLDGYDLNDLTHEKLIKRTAVALARRGLVRMAGSRIFITRDGFACSIGEAA